MESSWRLNVPEFGLNLWDGSGYHSVLGLIAIYLPNPVIALSNSTDDGGASYVAFQDLGGDLGWAYGHEYLPMPGHPHFPYGFDDLVEPDH